MTRRKNRPSGEKISNLHQRAPSINKPYTNAPSSGTGYFLSSIISNLKTNKSIGIRHFLNKDTISSKSVFETASNERLKTVHQQKVTWHNSVVHQSKMLA